MTLDAAYAGRLRQIAEMPAALPPASLGDIWRAEWAATGLDTVETTIDPFRSAYDDLAKRVADTGGKGLAVLADQYGVDLGQTRGIGDQIVGLERLIDRLPEEQRKALEPHRNVMEAARRNAREIEKRAEEVGAATYGLSGYATSFAAGISRQMVSPVNLALIPLGGPLTGTGVRGVGLMLAREAAYGAAGQAIQEPVIAAGRERLGLETSSFENIAQAAIGQAAFAGVFRAGAAGFRAMQDYRGARAAATEARAAAEFAPFDFAAGAPLAPRLGGPFGAGVDQSGRLALAPGEVPRIDLPEGVRIESRSAPSAGSVSDNLSGPARLGTELNAPASGVGFGRFEQSPQLRDVPDLSPQLRDVATRLEPEDFEAIALLEERNAAIDVQARALGEARDVIEANMASVNATREQRALVQDERLPALNRSDAALREAEAALVAHRENPLAGDAELLAVKARADAAQAELDGLTGRRKVSPRAAELRDLVAEAEGIISDMAAAREAELRLALAAARGERASAGAALQEGLRSAGVRELDAERLMMIQADAVEAAAAAMEHGRVAPQPEAFKTPVFRPTTVTASTEAFRAATALDIALRARPDVADLVAAARKAGDPDEANPFTNVFFSDATRAVPVPDDVAIKRITKAMERAASAEAVGAPRWSVEGIAALAARIDTPVSELPTPRQALPRGEAVRVRVKDDSIEAGPSPQPSPSRGEGASAPLSLKDALRVQSVERQLAEIGDAPIVVGDKVTTARAELARLADDRQALDALDACTRTPGGDVS